MKNKFLVLILSFLFPGLGHLYIKSFKKGICLIFISVFLIYLSKFNGLITFLQLPLIIFSIIDSLIEVNKDNSNYENK
ncbi:DUF6677 family protein [Clostridium perfringens]|uniref:DUF6677 family protein n=1 Tax=Clostridium perfringens TaxID=1502 RepID=UPI0039EA6A46